MLKLADVRRHVVQRRNDGFTLIELVVVVALLGLISAVLASAIVVVLRNNPANTERLDDSRVVKGLVTWLPQDIDSTPTGGFETDRNAPTGCSGANPGVSILKLTWTEQLNGTTTRFRSNYRYVTEGEQATVVRITCHGTGAEPLGAPATITVASSLQPLPGDWDPGELPARVVLTYNGPEVQLVRTELRTATGKVMRVEAASKNPSATLPPTTTVAPPSTTSTTTSTTTTTTTTTTVPIGTTTTSTSTTTTSSTTTAATTTTLPCIVATPTIAEASGTPNNGKVRIFGSGNSGGLEVDVTVNITWTGGCQGLKLSYKADGATVTLRNFSPGSPAHVTLPKWPNGEIWDKGLSTLTVISAAGVHTSKSIEIVKSNQPA